MTPRGPVADLVVVGAGLMGAAVAQQVHAAVPQARIVLVDAGAPLGPTPGQHLHDTRDQTLRDEHLQRVSPGIQSLYRGAATSPSMGGSVRGVRPGMYDLAAFGADARAMPAAAVGWNAGGMGVHWTAATPDPWGSEVFPTTGGDRWDDDLATARSLLRVHPDPLGRTAVGERLLERLTEVFGPASAPGRGPQPMPMAVAQAGPDRPDGPLARTGPNVVFPRLAEPSGDDVGIVTGALVTEVLHTAGRVAGVRLRDVESGRERDLAARAVVVAADTLRTPQLLFASGVRPAALGTHLNEHAFLTGQVLPDMDRLGIGLEQVPLPRDGEWFIGSYWLPHSGPDQPFHGQVMDRVFLDEDGGRLAYSVGLSWYVPTEVQSENRLEFDGSTLDAAGLPRTTVRFSHSARDLELIELARDSQRRAATALGPFDPGTGSALLAAGSSLHFTGTARCGPSDDGTTVCDPDGRVWGFDDLFLAGGAVVPTAVVGNSTLVGMVTAVRAARAVVRLLAG